MQSSGFDIKGMTCSACVAHIEKNVRKVQGVQQVQVNLLTNSMTVEFDETSINYDPIIKSVEEAGYEAIPKNKTNQQKAKSITSSYG